MDFAPIFVVVQVCQELVVQICQELWEYRQQLVDVAGLAAGALVVVAGLVAGHYLSAIANHHFQPSPPLEHHRDGQDLQTSH